MGKRRTARARITRGKKRDRPYILIPCDQQIWNRDIAMRSASKSPNQQFTIALPSR